MNEAVTTATGPIDLGTIPREQARLRARLARARRSLRLQMGLETLLDLAAIVVPVGAALVGLDAALRLGLVGREVVLAVAVAAALAVLIGRSVPRIRAARLDDLAIAMTLDRARPGTGQQVADVLQLPTQLAEARSASPALIGLAVRRATEALDAADWSAHWNRRRTVARGLGLVLLLAVPVGFARIAPESARLSFARWLRGSDERWPQSTYMAVVGLEDRAGLIAPRDEAMVVEVRSDLADARPVSGGWSLPGRGEPLTIRRRPDPPVEPSEVRVRERVGDGTTRVSPMTLVGPGRFRLELPPASASTVVGLTGGDDWLGPIRIDRVDRPALESIRLRVRDPGPSSPGSDPGRPFREVADARQHPVFLPDTEIELTLVGTEPVASGRVDLHPGAAPSLERIDATTYVARWTLREPTTLEIGLTSASTGLASKPTFLSLGLMRDREPRVVLKPQGIGAHVTAVATLPMTLAATDDLGLAALRLTIERTTYLDEKSPPVTSKKAVAIPLPGGGRAVLDHQGRHDVDLQADPPPVGAVLRLQAEADDGCARGPQTGRSGIVHLQVVTPDELFYEILIRQRAERAKFVSAVDAMAKLGPSLAGTPSAEAATEATRAVHLATRQLDGIAGKVADSLGEMKLNQVGSPKSHRLLQDGVIDPIRALLAGPAAGLRAALQGLRSTGTKAAADAEAARKLHGEVVARMRAILDQMSQWESFVDVVNQVAEVIKIQRRVLEATEQARDARTKEVFDEKP